MNVGNKIKTKKLGHLGLVVGMRKELNISEIVIIYNHIESQETKESCPESLGIDKGAILIIINVN